MINTCVYYLERVQYDKEPSKNNCLFIDSKQSNNPGEAEEREEDEEGFEEFPVHNKHTVLTAQFKQDKIYDS